MKQVALGFIFLVLLGSPQLSLSAQSGESLYSPAWETSDDAPVGIAGKLFPGLAIRDVMPVTTMRNTELLTIPANSRLRMPLVSKYRSFSAMFICRELTEEQKAKVSSIYKAFYSFARYIGNWNAAVWVGQDTPPVFDVGEGKNSCDFFGLNYNGGPYVVYYEIKEARPQPGAVEVTVDSTVINFHGVQTDRIPNILNVLEQGIRTGQSVSGWLLYEKIKQVLLTFMHENSEFIQEIVEGISIYALPRGSVSLRPGAQGLISN